MKWGHFFDFDFSASESRGSMRIWGYILSSNQGLLWRTEIVPLGAKKSKAWFWIVHASRWGLVLIPNAFSWGLLGSQGAWSSSPVYLLQKLGSGKKTLSPLPPWWVCAVCTVLCWEWHEPAPVMASHRLTWFYLVLESSSPLRICVITQWLESQVWTLAQEFPHAKKKKEKKNGRSYMEREGGRHSLPWAFW